MTSMRECRNIYKTARESSGFTQEKAAELTGVSVESIRAYELGHRIPPTHVVVNMVDVYGTQYLAYQHLRNADDIAGLYLPDVDVLNMSAAVLRLLKEVADFVKRQPELIAITCDGIIDEEEKPRFDEIMQELNDIVQAYFSLKFSVQNRSDCQCKQ